MKIEMEQKSKGILQFDNTGERTESRIVLTLNWISIVFVLVSIQEVKETTINSMGSCRTQ